MSFYLLPLGSLDEEVENTGSWRGLRPGCARSLQQGMRGRRVRVTVKGLIRSGNQPEKREEMRS